MKKCLYASQAGAIGGNAQLMRLLSFDFYLNPFLSANFKTKSLNFL